MRCAMSASRAMGAIFAATLVLALSAGTRAEGLKGSCTVAQETAYGCELIHGRLWLANGGRPVRVWEVGSKRVLSEEGDSNWDPLISRYLRFGSNLYGDFEICALAQDEPGHMRPV